MEEDSGKTIEELAREALEAIKNAEKQHKRREEAELRAETEAREAELLQEVKRKIAKKLKAIQEEDKIVKKIII